MLRPALILLPALFSQINAQGHSCCATKVVGGITYEVAGRDGNAYSLGCTNDCTYYREGDYSKVFCFKPGQLEAMCSANTTGYGGYGMTTPSGGNGGGSGESGSSGGGVASNAEYCAANSDHTMCKYDGPSADCSAKTIYRELSASAKQAILDKHNELRRRVAKGEETGGINAPQPEASNMKKMVWNTELEAIAQRWADQCNFGHDSTRDKIDGTMVGQNAYWGANSAEQAESIIQDGMTKSAQAWYDEVTDPGFNTNNINPYVFDYGTGHYTQVVWADSEELGCGMVYYKGDTWYENLVICNYAVTGNFIGQAMYKLGSPCSECPSGYTCDDGLCAKA